MHLISTKQKIQQEDESHKKFQMLSQQFSNEKIIQGDLTENSNLRVEVLSLTLTAPSKKYKNLFVKLNFGDQSAQTQTLNDPFNLVWNEVFELYEFSNKARSKTLKTIYPLRFVRT